MTSTISSNHTVRPISSGEGGSVLRSRRLLRFQNYDALRLTAEHIIPEVIGGRLRSDFLCKPCNNTLGTTTDSRLKSDPQIRKAAPGLREALPGLLEAIENGAAYVGRSGYGEFLGSIKNGSFRPRPLKPGDGSLMLANPEAREAIVQMLKKQGRDSEIPAALERFDGAPVNERIEIASGIEIIEGQTEGIGPALEGGGSVPDAWPLKTAYEFLALCMGRAIYEPTFDPFRQVLRTGKWNEEAVTVERLQSEHLAPTHGLLLEKNDPHARVQVRLFRRICYRVHFRRIAVSGNRWLYHQDLAKPSEVIAIHEPEQTGTS